MAIVNVNVPMDEELKAQAEALFERLGLDTTTAVRIFLKAALAKEGFPFAVRQNKKNTSLAYSNLRPEYQEAIDDSNLQRNLIGPFHTAEEAFAQWMEND